MLTSQNVDGEMKFSICSWCAKVCRKDETYFSNLFGNVAIELFSNLFGNVAKNSAELKTNNQ